MSELPDGALVLDLACGTGEPGLTLAQMRPELRVMGIDSSPTLLSAARAKIERGKIANVQFEMMSLEELDIPSGSVNAIISRMGALVLGDPERTAHEAARVLQEGGPFSIAIWDKVERHPLLTAGIDILTGLVPDENVPHLAYLDEMAMPGVRERWLRDAGMSTVNRALHTWVARYTTFDGVWEYITDDLFPHIFNPMDDNLRNKARAKLFDLLSRYRTTVGSYQIPTTCQLLWGTR